MKLRKVNFKNHSIFNDLELSFVDENEQTFNTVIFAGENGVGKTVLLNILYKLLNLPCDNQEVIALLGNGSYEFELSEQEMKETLLRSYPEEVLHKDRFIVKLETTLNVRGYCNIYVEESINHLTVYANHLYAIRNMGNIRGIFSDTEINFKAKTINNVTASQIDDIRHGTTIRNNENLPTQLKQLLIDLYHQDNSAIVRAMKDSPKENYSDVESRLDLKINRFTSAFEKMIENKRMINADVRENTHQIIFQDLRNNQEISIDDLSSGEKQIIYRGSFLLANRKVLEDPIVFIDEPEISLHPDWQMKILDFYKNILTNQITHQLEAQLFVVTHSPFILHNINLETDKVIILERDEKGNVRQKQANEFYNYTSPELIKSAFKLPKEMFSTEKNIIFVEGKTDKQYVDKTIEVFGLPATNIEVKFIGSDSVNQNNGTGESNLQKALEFLSHNHTVYNQKICILFDNDDGKGLKEKQTRLAVKDKIFVKIHNFNSNNTKGVTRGIENLIVFPNDFPLDDYNKEEIITRDNGYGKTEETKKYFLQKQELADKICGEENEVLQSMLIRIKESIESIITDINQ